MGWFCSVVADLGEIYGFRFVEPVRMVVYLKKKKMNKSRTICCKQCNPNMSPLFYLNMFVFLSLSLSGNLTFSYLVNHHIKYRILFIVRRVFNAPIYVLSMEPNRLWEAHAHSHLMLCDAMAAKRSELIHGDRKFLALEFLKGDLLPPSSLLLYYCL